MSRHAVFASALLALVISGTPARSADVQQTEAAKRFNEALQGKWQMTSRLQDGVPSEPELIKNRTVTFEGDKYIIRDGEKVIAEPNYKVDPSKSPAWLDVVHKSGESAVGIIKLEGDTLIFCAVGSEGTRPTEFKSEPGDGRLVVQFKRLKQ
jgi:uncharacterized protein (TIGR03067 family)